MSEISLSLYLHFPWCVKKCPYCDFNSHAQRGDVPETAYVDALLRDLDFELRDRETRPLVSIFMGGGTPSLFSSAAMQRVLDGVRQRLSFAPNIEITLEANPGTADAANFAGYRAAGVNRLSIGVQSMNAAHLKALGRIHGPDEARRAVQLARDAGFDNINLDMMFALPAQTSSEAENDLHELLTLRPEHVSYYHLTLEPNTEFHAKPPSLPDTDSAYAMLETGQQALMAAGYAQYEVSAYAKPSRESRHNLNYWTFGDYLGIGAGAHGKRTQTQSIVRTARHKHPKTYRDHAGTAAAVQETRTVTAADLPLEYAMNALRLHTGFSFTDFERHTGLRREVLAPTLSKARTLDLLEHDAETVRPSARGRAHLNRLLELFLP